MMKLEKNCINYTKGKCIIKKLAEDNLSCENCFHKKLLEEGEEITITETYTLKRVNGNLVKVITDEENETIYFNKTGLNHEIFQKSLLVIENKWLADFFKLKFDF